MSNVLGQGSYGCIHKPSLRCGDSKPDDFYEDHVSKLMLAESAAKELAEYTKVRQADPKNEYYPGYPTLCKLNYKLNKNKKAVLSKTDDTSVNKCKMYVKNKQPPNDYRLLILADGGIDLTVYGNKVSEWKPSLTNTRKFEKFWIEAHRLFIGISVFLKHGLVHHDLKPHNIVYNEETNRLNYIDFGLMRKMTEMNRGSNTRWFNYPPEVNYYDVIKFRMVYKKSDEDIIDYVINENKEKHNAYHLQTFMRFALGEDSKDKAKADEFLQEYVKGCYETILAYILAYDYDAWDYMIEKSYDTFDIYGLGMSLYMLNCGGHLLAPDIKDGLKVIFYKMISSDVDKRPDIRTLINMYENFLKDSGLLDKYNKKVENHKIVNGPELSNKVLSVIEQLSVNEIIQGNVINKKEANAIAEKTPPPLKVCPEGKELNPKTKKCVLNCKAGYTRSPATFRCIKVRKPKEQKPKEQKPKVCPPGKELNPKTKKCVLNCKAGYTRNAATFRCTKVQKLKEQKPRVCPEGKVLNPNTKRCVKQPTSIKCPEGKVLNPNTKRCVKQPTSLKCPEGKVLNPKTKRCVKQPTSLKCPEGKVLNPKTKRCVKQSAPKVCPEGKVLNPKTQRCVKSTRK